MSGEDEKTNSINVIFDGVFHFGQSNLEKGDPYIFFAKYSASKPLWKPLFDFDSALKPL